MDRELYYDVAVVGGGSAGIAAAIGAHDAGAGTILLERNPYFGGQATHSQCIPTVDSAQTEKTGRR